MVRLLRGSHFCFCFCFLGVLEYARGSHLWTEAVVGLNVAEGFHGNDDSGRHMCSVCIHREGFLCVQYV